MYQVSKPVQLLVDLYIDGVTDFEQMLLILINKYKINGSFSDVKDVFENNSQFLDIFTFEECSNSVKVVGAYGKRYPFELHIELTNVCNLNCPHCYKKANEGTISFLDFQTLKNRIFDRCASQTRVLHLTGGEPTLHPEFKEIVDFASNIFHIQLTTNGANLWNIPVSTLSKISDIDISMYGTDRNSYEISTGNAYAYDNFEKTCALLRNNKIEFRINMIVNHINIAELDNYVVKAIELGATSFSFGVPVKTGRLIEKPDEEWYCDSDMTKKIYRYMRKASEKYADKISIVEWGRDVYSHKGSIFSNNYALPCKGGSFSWWMNEKMEFRPCAMIPEEYILLPYEEWVGYCESTFNINWESSYLKFEEFCSRKEMDPSDICYVFKRHT